MPKRRKKPNKKKGQTPQQNYRDRLYGYKSLFFKTLIYIDKADSKISDELKMEYAESLSKFENDIYLYELGTLERQKLANIEDSMGE